MDISTVELPHRRSEEYSNRRGTNKTKTLQKFFRNDLLSRRKNTSIFRPNSCHCLYACLLVICTQNYVTFGFNLDVNFPVFATISEKNSYFGFSVDIYGGDNESWLLVGAPKSQVRGEVYKCKYEINNSQSNCSRIKIDKDKAAAPTVKDMFGLTMMTGPVGKQLLACAPYFTDETRKRTQSTGTRIYYDMVGVCYFMDDFTNTDTNVYKLIPCASAKGSYHDGDAHGQCELGMSAAFTKNGDYLILGAPRSFYQGSLMLIPLPITSDITKLPIHTGDVSPEIPEGWETTPYLMQSYDENFLGYASATGKTIEMLELLVVGAPARFRYNLYGMVMVYDQEVNAALYNFTGSQPGEYFGSAIACADLDNDGLDDIIVGAPQYSAQDKRIYESGRIFIFYQIGAARNPADGFLELNFSQPVIIEGTKQRARFGFSISAIGDINQDGYEDIAVGAPYTVNDAKAENSDGSVFIFNGGPNGIITPASQEIKGMDLDEKLRAFGFSISGRKDVDKNLYPDVIAGAYLSDQAVLIRSRPVVKISSEAIVQPQVVDIEKVSCDVKESTTSCFNIKTCFTYTGKNVPESIELSYSYDIDSSKTGDEKRAFILDETPRNITLVRKTLRESETKCVSVYAFVKIDIRDKLSEINIKISHTLIAKNEPVQPVLNELKPPYAFTKVKIYRECGEDDICQADLRVTSDLDTTHLYAGRSWPLVLKQRVVNKGEPAFLSMLVVEYPDYINYVGTQKEGSTPGILQLCTSTDRFVTCEIGNPMKQDVSVDVNFKFQTLQLNGNFSSLVFKSFANSTNPTNNTSETVASAISIGVKSDIVIYNISSPEGFYFKLDEKKKYIRNTTSVRHVYQVINKGPSDLSKGTIQLTWPLETLDGKILLQLDEIVENHEFVSCAATKILPKPKNPKNATGDGNHYFCDGRAQCASVSCKVTSQFEQLQISAHFRLPFASVLQNDLDSFVRSDFKFKIDEYPYAISPGKGPSFEASTTTECRYQRLPATKEVQWWIIAIAIAAGILCLLLLVFILWWCGFFERKKKPQDEDDRMQAQALNPKSDPDDDNGEEEMEEYLK